MPKKNSSVPAWKQAQQKRTKPETKEVRQENSQIEAKPVLVKLRMLTGYRDLVSAGEIWETDAEKAEELVKLRRAEYVK